MQESSRTVLVIGGSSGIGRSLVGSLAGAGHRVVAASRTAPQAGLPAGVETQAFDATDEESTLVLPESLDALIYLPGSINLKPFQRLSKEEFQQDLDLNFFGAVRVLQMAYPALRKSGQPNASVVLFSTVAVGTGLSFHASIASAKGALEGLGRSLAAEWAPRVRVNVVAPSLTDTPLAGSLLAKEGAREASAKRHPLNLIGEPSEVAEMAAYLAVGASGFMTGQVLRPDGGLSSVRPL